MNTKLYSFSGLATALILATGCSSLQSKQVEPESEVQLVEAEAKIDRVTRDLTMTWGNIGRGGAAIRQPAYIHVLGEGNLVQSKEDALFSDSAPPADAAVVITALNSIIDSGDGITSSNSGEQGGFSMYELSRWERFCDNGKAMDEPDWRFVTKHGGASGVPSIYQASCAVPKHTAIDYMSAWVGFCSGSNITPEQRAIVRNSSRPITQANPCLALLE